MPANKQFENNLECCFKDLIHLNLKKFAFHIAGLKRAFRQCWHDVFIQLK